MAKVYAGGAAQRAGATSAAGKRQPTTPKQILNDEKEEHRKECRHSKRGGKSTAQKNSAFSDARARDRKVRRREECLP